MDLPESEPLVKDFFATIDGSVGAVDFKVLTEEFPSSAISITIWNWEELVVGMGVF